MSITSTTRLPASGAETFLHLVYIHGFQGNDTSFQSFPTDLQEHLSANIPSHLNLKIHSSLYPTYKSRKPIAFATKNFLAWLSTQPPGPVILVSHSMGGLLAADAATDSSNTGTAPRHRRIVGIIAFDVPYLGMHPHVVVSGIASLFPDKDAEQGPTPADLNQHKDVDIVEDQVTDDWDAYKAKADAKRSRSRSPLPSPSSESTAPSSISAPPSPHHTPFKFDKAMNFLSAHYNDPLPRWLRKHSDEPFGAGVRFITEYFQFGSCMFDPSGLKERYSRLVDWPGGMWVNYWTQTVPRGEASLKADDKDKAENDVALLETGLLSPTSSISSAASSSLSSTTVSSASSVSSQSDYAKAAKAAAKALKKLEKQRAKEEKRRTATHHFIVLPTGLGQMLGGGERWERVVIGGVEDEVAAHCGLFIRGQNLDYEGLVERVGRRVLGWCEAL
ncbi:hypothetical protein R3P38DRAFT_3335844 [Favolaschia claudopus]|uniref:AB hydrolase-1 domain-containing protein n=1 Tax=Favolaschia claudopus TaxID=2862362 RepID=A0AAV9Z8L7_9AGAR